jgi:hypothetical protein
MFSCATHTEKKCFIEKLKILRSREVCVLGYRVGASAQATETATQSGTFCAIHFVAVVLCRGHQLAVI